MVECLLAYSKSARLISAADVIHLALLFHRHDKEINELEVKQTNRKCALEFYNLF